MKNGCRERVRCGMQERRNKGVYSSQTELVRVRPHDDRAARHKGAYNSTNAGSCRRAGGAPGSGKNRRAGKNRPGRGVDVKMTLMVAVTLVLLFLSGMAVKGMVQSLKNPDMTGASLTHAEGNGEEGFGFPGPGNIVPVVDENQDTLQVLVAIDPGHGGVDNGSNVGKVYEQEINLEIALRLADKLEDMGIDTLLLREDNDTGLSLEERVKKAENAGADIYVSIHQNFYDGKDTSVSGMETWYCGELADSRRLAELIHNEVAERTGANDRGLIESDDLYVVREASMPSCLIETGFLSNQKEREALLTEKYQEKIAEGIAEGIREYFQAEDFPEGKNE